MGKIVFRMLFAMIFAVAALADVRAKDADAIGEEAGPIAWLPGPTPQWHIRMDTALAAAAREHKKIFVLSTVSDFYSFFYMDVLSRPEFDKFTKGRLVLVYLDYPSSTPILIRRKMLVLSSTPMPEFQQVYNKALGKAMHFSSGVPAAFVLDENGRRIGAILGCRPLAKYMQALREILKRAPAKDAPLPPDWVKKSPKELTPMLEILVMQERDKAHAAAQVNARAAAARAAAVKKEISFRVVAWGLAEDKVDTPFDPRKPIRVPAGTRIYFKVRYRTPENSRSILYLRMPGVHATGFGKPVSGSGEFVAMLCYRRSCHQKKIQIFMKLRVPESEDFLAAELPCDVTWQ